MSKKGQSISINTIIIAAIALAVLVVLFVIFTGRIGIFSQGVAKTTTCENACKSLGKTSGVAEESTCKGDNRRTYVPGKYDDVIGEGNVCCCSP